MRNRNEGQRADLDGSAAERSEAVSLPEPSDLGEGDHPQPETIAAYGAGGLEASREEGVRAHLETCEECRDLLLLGIPEEAGEESNLIDFAKELVWSRLETQRVREAGEAARAKAVDVERRRRRERFLAAASVALALVPLAGLYNHYESTIDGLTRPQLNVAVHDVLPPDLRGVRGSGDSESGTFDVPHGTELFTLVFPVGARGEGPLRVELAETGGRLIWSQPGLEVDPYGFATLGLSRRFLKAGSYRIRVFSEAGGSKPLEDLPIEIRYP